MAVCYLDAHGDLREEWEGSRFSHACVLRRIAELQLPIFHLGLRSFSREEADLVRDNPLIRTYSSREILLQDGLSRFTRDLADSAAGRIFTCLWTWTSSIQVCSLEPALPSQAGYPGTVLLEAIRTLSAREQFGAWI